MDPKDRSEQGFPGEPYLHRKAADLLALINQPELLETQTLSDICRTFEKSDYEMIPEMEVTVGWGRKVGEAEAFTSTMIVTKDRKLVHIGMGSEGAYYVVVNIQNVDHPTESEQETLRRQFSAFLSLPHIRPEKTSNGGIGLGGIECVSPRAVEVCERLYGEEIGCIRQRTRHQGGEIMNEGQ